VVRILGCSGGRQHASFSRDTEIDRVDGVVLVHHDCRELSGAEATRQARTRVADDSHPGNHVAAILYKVSAQNDQPNMASTKRATIDSTVLVDWRSARATPGFGSAKRLGYRVTVRVNSSTLHHRGTGRARTGQPRQTRWKRNHARESWNPMFFCEFGRRQTFPSNSLIGFRNCSSVDDTHLSNATGVNFEDAILVTQEAVYLLGLLPPGLRWICQG